MVIPINYPLRRLLFPSPLPCQGPSRFPPSGRFPQPPNWLPFSQAHPSLQTLVSSTLPKMSCDPCCQRCLPHCLVYEAHVHQCGRPITPRDVPVCLKIHYSLNITDPVRHETCESSIISCTFLPHALGAIPAFFRLPLTPSS